MRTAAHLWLALAGAAALLGACPGDKGPGSAAVDEYLRRGDAPPSLSGASDAPAPPPPAARVALTVVSGKGLPDTDSGPGVTDPYVIVEYAGQRWETSVIDGSLDPVWGDSFILDVVPGGILTLTLMDEDAFTSDHKIGVVSAPLDPPALGESVTREVSFRGGEGGVVTITLTGMVRR